MLIWKKRKLFGIAIGGLLLFLLAWCSITLMLKASHFNSNLNRVCQLSEVDTRIPHLARIEGYKKRFTRFYTVYPEGSPINSYPQYNSIALVQSKNWLARKVFGESYPWELNRVVDLKMTLVKPALFDEIGQFSKLNLLELTDTPCTAKQLTKLAELKNLELLFLNNCNLQDEGIDVLADKLDLTVIYLEEEPLLTDRAVQYIFNSKTITTASLSNLTNPKFSTSKEPFPVSKSIKNLVLMAEIKRIMTTGMKRVMTTGVMIVRKRGIIL